MARHTTGVNNITVQRMALWVLQALSGATFFVLWTMIQEMRIDVASLKASLAAKETSVAELKIKTTQTDEIVKEVRSELKSLNNAMQDVRIALQQRK